MGKYEILYETPHHQKRNIFFMGILAVVILGGVIYAGTTIYDEQLKNTRTAQAIMRFVESDVSNFTGVGLFYLGFLGGLFFIPLPIESFFYFGLLNGNRPFVALLLMLTGILIAQVINYNVGLRLSNVVMNFISRKKVYAAKRWVNKYGYLAIFVMSLTPMLPYPLLTFVLGIARYNVIRLFGFFILGNVLKYSILIGIFVFFGKVF